MNVNFEAIEKAWFKPKKHKPSEIKILDKLDGFKNILNGSDEK